IEAIFSAADIGFKGSLLTSPAAYMGTITGCFLLTIFLVSIPREHKSFLLLWEPPHWYLSPYASWMSCSSVHTSISSLHTTGMEGKQTSNIRSRRLSNVVYTKEKIFMSSLVTAIKISPILQQDGKQLITNTRFHLPQNINCQRNTRFFTHQIQATKLLRNSKHLALCKGNSYRSVQSHSFRN
uniref:Uncharacterized protein n=1 Tax=Taeniopygia guttata TaxID=59729 RepID=A0A674HUL4_TAEGU